MALIAGVQYSGNAPGTILPCAKNSALPMTLLCNGDAVSRTTYAALFAAIGTTYGVGNGSTTFNLPDTRGIFLRGAGTNGTMTNANGSAYSATLGATQNDQMQGHIHYRNQSNATEVIGITGGGGYGIPTGSSSFLSNQNDKTGLPLTDATNGTPRTGVETRPANLGINYCIAY